MRSIVYFYTHEQQETDPIIYLITCETPQPNNHVHEDSLQGHKSRISSNVPDH